jgi:hypothetical protein
MQDQQSVTLVDVHFSDGAKSMSLSVLFRKLANNSSLD